MPTQDELYTALRNADASGDHEGAQKLADYIKSQWASKPQILQQNAQGQIVPVGTPNSYDPTVGMSGFEKFRAGYGKGVVDLGRGVGQMAGITSRQDVADARQLDAPLMATGAGKAGDITGTIASALPTAMIPGANTLAGSAAVGAGLGLAQPSTSTSETLTNTLAGGVISPAGVLVGRGLGVGYQALRSMVQPLTRGGQETIAANALRDFVGGPQGAQDAISSIQGAGSGLAGVRPTTAELANSPGLSQFERSLRNNPAANNLLTLRLQTNRAALSGSLDSIAGTSADMDAATAARTAWSKPMYDAAKTVAVPTDRTLADLVTRPSMQDAWKRAAKLAAENGEQLTLPSPDFMSNMKLTEGQPISGQAIQYLKMALNDIVDTGEQKGMGVHEQNAMKSTLAQLNGWTSKNVQQLRDADATYQAGSSWINRMQLGGQLRDKLVPALGDFGNNTRLTANSFAQAVRNGDTLAARVTGQGDATLAGTMTPNEMGTINQVGQQLARRANAEELGRVAGSPTAQNLISQQMLSNVLGPTGLPQGVVAKAAQSSLAQSLQRPFGFLARAGEDPIMAKLAGAALDPQEAVRLLSKTPPSNSLSQAIWQRQGLAGLGALSAAYILQ